MNKRDITAILAVTSFAFSAGALAQGMTKPEYETGKNRITAQLKSDKEHCRSVTGNRKELTEVCVAHAESQEKIAKAQLEAHYSPTEETRNQALAAKQEAKNDYLRKANEDGAQASHETVAEKQAEKQRVADYTKANNECNMLGGTAKTTCINKLQKQHDLASE